MAVKFESVKAGDTLWQYKRQKMGNTTMSTIAEYRVLVESIDYENKTAMVRWNGNPARPWSARNLAKLFRNRKELVRDVAGRATYKARRKASSAEGA